MALLVFVHFFACFLKSRSWSGTVHSTTQRLTGESLTQVWAVVTRNHWNQISLLKEKDKAGTKATGIYFENVPQVLCVDRPTRDRSRWQRSACHRSEMFKLTS
ncbi:hypothetical protein BDV28DRAFT_142412 [Aspergillus coremiiformis]|uniref:Secreted protein n=1 Tax=Aspergillus coremiiformis TaxID=138285 RepID=A0A5N6YWY6_9EURO|nr:hypothetical protein BDV28DRAFT_142412 [Aspergillus coremiiformis]